MAVAHVSARTLVVSIQRSVQRTMPLWQAHARLFLHGLGSVQFATVRRFRRAHIISFDTRRLPIFAVDVVFQVDDKLLIHLADGAFVGAF